MISQQVSKTFERQSVGHSHIPLKENGLQLETDTANTKTRMFNHSPKDKSIYIGMDSNDLNVLKCNTVT